VKQIFMAVLMLGLMVGVSSCSSAPDTQASAGAVSNEREEYAGYVEKQLTSFQDDIDDVKGYSRNEIQATINDSRAELRGLKSASDPAWRSYKMRLDKNLVRLRDRFNQAKAAE